MAKSDKSNGASFENIYSPLDVQKPRKENGPENSLNFFKQVDVKDPLNLIPGGE